MTPEALEAEIDRCIGSEACDVNHFSGLVKAAGVRPNVPLSQRTELQLQLSVLQCKLQVGTIDEDVVDITSSLSLQLPEFKAVAKHQILLRTRAVLHDLEENELPMDCFADTVEALFEASDDDSEDFAAALADRKNDLLRFCNALAGVAGTDSSAHSLLVAQTSYSYPKADALAALTEVVQALRAYLQTLGPACITLPPQADAAGSLVAGCEQANSKGEQPAMGREGPGGQPPDTAQSTGSTAPGLERAAAGDMQQLSMKQSCANSDVDILNTPTSQSQRALVTRLGMASRHPWKQPDPTPVDHGDDPAAGDKPVAQPGDGGSPLQPADLTESQLLVPDSYTSEMPASDAHPELLGDGGAEPQPEAQSQDVGHPETQYQDVLQDEEMPEQELSEWQVPDREAEEEVGMEDDGVGTENQENCSLHSNSQAPAACSQGKKGSHEVHIRGSDSPEGPQGMPLLGMPHEAQAEYEEPNMGEGLKAARAGAEAHAAGDSAGNNALVEAHEDVPADAEAMHAPEAEVVPDAEEDFQDAESDEGSSESDYDSPSWQGSGEDLLFGSEQQDKGGKSQSESQEPVLHLSLGIDSSEQSQRAPQSRADMRAQETAQPTESQEAQREAPLDPDRNGGPTAATGVEGEAAAATIGEQDNEATGVPGSMARMTVVTKPDALAQPRRHKAKRRTLTSPKKVTRAGEVEQQAAADDHQGNEDAAEAVADEIGVAGRASSLLMVDLTEEPAEVNSGVAVAASTVTPDEVVRSFLRVRDGAAAEPAPPGGLTELMGVIHAGLLSGTAAAAAPAAQGAVAPGPSAAAVRPPHCGGYAHGSAAAAAAASSLQTARSGTATGELGHGNKDGVNGGGQTAAAEPAWRTKGSAAARIDGRASKGLVMDTCVRASAPAAAASIVDGPGEDSWHSLIAGLSTSAAVEAQPYAAPAAARELPLVPEGALEAQPTGNAAAARQPLPMRGAAAGSAHAAQLHEADKASLSALASPQRPDRAQGPPRQADRGRGSRMAELQFHATSHGSRTPVQQETGTPSAGRPSNADLPGRLPKVAEQQKQAFTGCTDRSTDTMGPQVAIPSTAVAAPVDSRTQPAPKRSRKQDSAVPLGSPPPAAKRQRVQAAAGGGSGGSLWDLANNVMVHMAQRLMPGAPAVQNAPPQAPASEAPVAPDQQPATAPSIPTLQTTTGISGSLEQLQDQISNPAPRPLQTAALRAVVEAAITNPGAVALPTLVPARYLRAHQKAAAAVRAASARASAQRAASAPVEVPLVQTEATPSSIGQDHLPSRMPHLPAPASASYLPNTGRRAEPMVQLASHRHIEDEVVPPLSQRLGASSQQGAAHLPGALAAGLQQPLTQLPSPGYDGAAVADWPEHTPAPQPLMPALERRRPLSAQPQFMPSSRHESGTALHGTPAGMGPFPSTEVLSEQRQWPLDAASRRGTGREYLSTDGPPAFSAAREWGRREQGMHYDAGHVQAGAAALHTGLAPRSMPVAPHGQAHIQMQQQQQDFSFQMPQVQQRGYTPQQSDLAEVPGFGVSSRPRVPWDLAQSAARAQQQPLTAQPFSPQVQGCQQEMSPLPHTHARQRPTAAMGTGHSSLPAGCQPGMAVCGDLAPEHPAAVSGTGYSSLRPGGDPAVLLYGRLLPAQQQLMWQYAPPTQEGQMQASTAWGPSSTGTQMACPPLAAYPGPLPEQQSWQYQQRSRPGFAPEHNHGQEVAQHGMSRHVKPVEPPEQQAPFLPPLRLYSPRHGSL
ncbi:g9253 [Coccomyxa elongata]